MLALIVVSVNFSLVPIVLTKDRRRPVTDDEVDQSGSIGVGLALVRVGSDASGHLPEPTCDRSAFDPLPPLGFGRSQGWGTPPPWFAGCPRKRAPPRDRGRRVSTDGRWSNRTGMHRAPKALVGWSRGFGRSWWSRSETRMQTPNHDARLRRARNGGKLLLPMALRRRVRSPPLR